MNFAELEKFYCLLDCIEGHKKFLSQLGDVQATQFDSTPHSRTCRADKMGEIAVHREQALDRLRRLQALEEEQRPLVLQTIKAVAGSGRGAIKIELAMRMRYLIGRDWPEIADAIGEKQVKTLIIKRLQKTEDNK